jgi:phosphoglucomutase
MLICEMTAYYHAKNMTLCDALEKLYEKYGYCLEANEEIYMEGVDGPARMAALLDGMRQNIPNGLGGVKVVTFGDYNEQTFTSVKTGETSPTGLPRSNMLSFKLENGDVVIVRPSGTEPKVKFYFMVSAADRDEALTNIENYKKTLNI